eukprot:TRINITY_DN12408_c0_g1_i5.p2 TRINITY_DN12408_c0_g1~~TRINITY_DN12408_c0_g1_i5.p2  ORF type:complete len:107 (-),score=4.03 TRINITY_DN12408_c0_g1_i5:724-1044(-)
MVHLDVYTCMTGVSRFLHASSSWTYDKTEDLSVEEIGAREFDYIISEKPAYPGYSTMHMAPNHQSAGGRTHDAERFHAQETRVKFASVLPCDQCGQVHTASVASFV